MAAQQQSLLNVQSNLANVIKNIESNLFTTIQRLENNVIDKIESSSSNKKKFTLAVWSKDWITINIMINIDTNNISNSILLSDLGFGFNPVETTFYSKFPSNQNTQSRRLEYLLLSPRFDMSDIENWIFTFSKIGNNNFYTAWRIIQPYEFRFSTQDAIFSLGFTTPELFALNQPLTKPLPIYVGRKLDFQSSVVPQGTNYVGTYIIESNNIYELHTKGYSYTDTDTNELGIYKSNVRIPFETGEYSVDAIIRDPDSEKILFATLVKNNQTKLVKLNEENLNITSLIILKNKRCLTRMRFRGRHLYILLASTYEDQFEELKKWEEENIKPDKFDIIKEYIVRYDIDKSTLDEVVQTESQENFFDGFAVPIIFSSPTDIGIIDNLLVVSRWSVGGLNDVLVYDLDESFPLVPKRQKIFLRQEDGYDPWIQCSYIDTNPNGLKAYIINNERYVLMNMKHNILFLNIDNMDHSKFVKVCNIPEYALSGTCIQTIGNDVVFSVSPTTNNVSRYYIQVSINELFNLGTDTINGAYGEIPILDIECITAESIVNIISTDDGNKFAFNNSEKYYPNYNIGIGKYLFKNISENHPMAILIDSEIISYKGDETKMFKKTVNNKEYNFYYGNIEVNVLKEFSSASIYCYNHGYMGGENLLKFNNICNIIKEEEQNKEKISTHEIEQALTNSALFNRGSQFNKDGITFIYEWAPINGLTQELWDSWFIESNSYLNAQFAASGNKLRVAWLTTFSDSGKHLGGPIYEIIYLPSLNDIINYYKKVQDVADARNNYLLTQSPEIKSLWESYQLIRVTVYSDINDNLMKLQTDYTLGITWDSLTKSVYNLNTPIIYKMWQKDDNPILLERNTTYF